MSSVVLEAKGLSKILGSGASEVHALREISLRLRAGELTMLMGPSGSGKTTLLSILGCMLTPSAGQVVICGRSTDGADAEQLALLRRRHIGFVFQQYHLFPTLTAAENVQLALDVRGELRQHTRAASHDALAQVGLGNRLRSYPRELSGGEQQRVAIARAIVSKPSAILADEPTAALDGSNGQTIIKILAQIAHGGASVLVVTHDSRLTSFAHRIIFIEDGRLVREQAGEAAKSKHLIAVAGGR